jgi:hypothetical protein
MAPLQCPHAEHGETCAPLELTAAGFWICCLQHSFELVVEDGRMKWCDLASFARRRLREGQGVEVLPPLGLGVFEEKPDFH